MDVFALVGQQELIDNPDILTSACAGVSLSVKWNEWFDRHIPIDWSSLKANGKKRMLRFHGGVWTPAGKLDINDGPIDTIPIVWQGTVYRWPKTWKPKYRDFLGQILGNRIYPELTPLLEPGDKFAVGFDTVESLEMHLPDEALAVGLTEAILLADWQSAITEVRSGVPEGVDLVLNVSPSISDWTTRILPEIHSLVDYTGCNILYGDPAQTTDAQGFLSLQYPGQKGNYMQRNMLSRWLGREPTFEERRENLIGMWQKCYSWGVEWLEIGTRDAVDFPDIILAAQAGDNPLEAPWV